MKRYELTKEQWEHIKELLPPETAGMPVEGSRGGLNTKVHAIVDGLGNPVEFMLSAGNDHDSVHAVELLKKVEISGSNVLADCTYGAKTI